MRDQKFPFTLLRVPRRTFVPVNHKSVNVYLYWILMSKSQAPLDIYSGPKAMNDSNWERSKTCLMLLLGFPLRKIAPELELYENHLYLCTLVANQYVWDNVSSFVCLPIPFHFYFFGPPIQEAYYHLEFGRSKCVAYIILSDSVSSMNPLVYLYIYYMSMSILLIEGRLGKCHHYEWQSPHICSYLLKR